MGQLIDIVETVYRGASKGRGLVVSPKGMSIAWSLARCSPCRQMGSGQKLTGHVCFFRLFDSVPILESSRALYLEYKDGCCVSCRAARIRHRILDVTCKWRVTAGFYLGVMVSKGLGV